MPTDPPEPEIVDLPAPAAAPLNAPASRAPVIRGETGLASRPATAYPLETPLAGKPSPTLSLGQRTGLAGGGGALIAAALLGHLAAPVAIPCILVGGVLWAVGFGFNRPLQSVRANRSGIGVEAEHVAVAASSIAREASELVSRRLELSRQWAQEIQQLHFRLENPVLTDTDIEREVAEFVRSRLADLTVELKTADEQVRASIWLVGADGKLGFTLGNEIDKVDLRFRPGEGIMGRAFRERRVWNVADGPRRPEYVKHRAAEPFHGLLCVPLDYGPGCIGVLCVDRTEPEPFAESALLVASTLAAHLVAALSFIRPHPDE